MSFRTAAAFPRRTLLAGTSALPLAVGGSGVAGAGSAAPLRLGLIGCGGRGTGAALTALADPAVRIVALADLFRERVAESARLLEAAAPHGRVARAARHVGPDAWRRLLDLPLDGVILAAPPATRPAHVAAAVDAARHAWCETPAAVDAAGLEVFSAALLRAATGGLVVASGLCGRFDVPTAETVRRVREGAIGRVRSIALHHHVGLPWRRPVSAGMPAAERRERNWIAFRELSGGYLVEHHVHALDRALWILGDDPLVAVAAVRPEEGAIPGFGDCPAGVHVRYTFASGAVVEASCRRGAEISGVVETVAGTAGRADLAAARVEGTGGDWQAAPVDPLARGGMYAAGMADFLHRVRSATSPAERLDGGWALLRATSLAVAGTVAAAAAPGGERPALALPRQTPSPSRSV